MPCYDPRGADAIHVTKERLDLVTRLLCDLCKTLERGSHIKICYELLRPSTELSRWWEEHKRLDAERIACEAKEAKEKAERLKKYKLRQEAISKLTLAEREALGLFDGRREAKK